MIDDFSGRVILVGGSTGGVGRAVANQLAARGAKLALHYNSRRRNAEELVRQHGADRALAVRADLTDRQAARAMVAEVVDHFGTIDGFISTVGTQLKLERFVDMPDATVDATVGVELVSVITVVQAVLRQMVQGNGGRIVLVGSDSGKAGTTGECVSAACRAGIIALAKSVAREYARDNILANVVCPGPTDTALWDHFVSRDDFASGIGNAMARAIPLGRLGTADEVAATGVFLLSQQASFITGQAISVSGGLTMH
jgi:2-hydroxycyclohexanecarboxyl-CoA dehydrogenase